MNQRKTNKKSWENCWD